MYRVDIVMLCKLFKERLNITNVEYAIGSIIAHPSIKYSDVIAAIPRSYTPMASATWFAAQNVE